MPPACILRISGGIKTTTSPNERTLGEANRSGAFARGRSISPPPSRVVGTSPVTWPSGWTGSPVCVSADFTCATVQAGCCSFNSAAAPATIGVAMLVPLSWPQSPSRCGSDEITLRPGALTSGLSCSETGVGPLDEKSAMPSAGKPRPFDTAATEIAPGALPGEPIEPRPNSSKSLPAATTGTTPAAAAASIASTTRSREGSISGSPRERLITSIPSLTAASIAAAISGALPSSPNSGVGIVRAL